jgi:hypothetical protein
MTLLLTVLAIGLAYFMRAFVINYENKHNIKHTHFWGD